MTDRLRDALRYQAEACRGLGSPFMDRLLRLLADRLQPGTPLTDRMFDWPGDLGPAAHSVPLRLCGALHALRLEGRAGLAPLYPPHDPSDDALWTGVEHALTAEAEFIDRFIDRPPQTNEVRRSVALIAAAHWITTQYDLPCRVSELGASAGINLNWHRFGLETPNGLLGPTDAALTLSPDWEGGVPGGPTPQVTDARGVDLNPLTDETRIFSYLWADQADRLALTRAALSAGPREVDKGDAVDWLGPRLPHQPGQTHLIYSTIAWQYFPPERQETGTRAIEAAGAAASEASPLAWLAMENDRSSPGAALTLRLWPGNRRHDLARVDFHGRWIRWDA